MKKFGNFSDVINWSADQLHDYSYVIHTEKWQGKEIKHDPKYSMIETLNLSFSCQINPSIEELIKQIRPNVSWADEHFGERVGGQPLNPPPSHERWPYAQKNNAEFGGLEKFSHTYPERIWPKFASETPNSKMEGIRYNYGDFKDVISLMHRDYIRSCDFFRHFRDDIYLCARKVLWLIDELKKLDYENWKDVKPGTLTMHVCSLHAWASEKPLLKKKRDI